MSLCLSEFGFVNKLFTSLFICIHFTKIVSPASFLNGFQFRLVCWLDITTGQTASVRPSVHNSQKMLLVSQFSTDFDSVGICLLIIELFDAGIRIPMPVILDLTYDDLERSDQGHVTFD